MAVYMLLGLSFNIQMETVNVENWDTVQGGIEIETVEYERIKSIPISRKQDMIIYCAHLI